MKWRERMGSRAMDGECVHTTIGRVDSRGRWFTRALVDGRRIHLTVQRLAWLNAYGDAGAVVWPMCLNKWCVNLDHLATGTRADMIAQAVAVAETWNCGHPRRTGEDRCTTCYNAWMAAWRARHPHVIARDLERLHEWLAEQDGRDG